MSKLAFLGKKVFVLPNSKMPKKCAKLAFEILYAP
jgi:hypothetical protein